MRLTIRNSDGTVSQPTNTTIKSVFDKLAEYEDAEEQGRLIKLLCKIGDPLYWISPEDDEGNEIDTVKQYDGGVASFVVSAEGIRVADKDATQEILRWSQEIGTEYAYLTPEEAEAALSKK